MPEGVKTIGDIARFLPGGDSAFTVEFGTGVDPVLNAQTVAAAAAFRALAPVGVVDVVPTFRSFTVHYDCRTTSAARLIGRIAALPLPDRLDAAGGRVHVLPVLYGHAGGPDLGPLAREAGLSEEEAVELHASVDYRVYMLGFLPGFAYLGDLPERLRAPRLATPRTRVPVGTVALADAMTAIYPSPSPGGWRLIGMTPVRLFDAQTGTALFEPGDHVRFRPVSSEEYRVIERAVRVGTWQPERAV